MKIKYVFFSANRNDIRDKLLGCHKSGDIDYLQLKTIKFEIKKKNLKLSFVFLILQIKTLSELLLNRFIYSRTVRLYSQHVSQTCPLSITARRTIHLSFIWTF